MADMEDLERHSQFAPIFQPLFPSAQNITIGINNEQQDAVQNGVPNWLTNSSFNIPISSILPLDKATESEQKPLAENQKKEELPKKRQRSRSRSKSPKIRRDLPPARPPKSVFIENTGLAPKHAFRIDRKPDGNNLAFTTFYHLHVAKYFRNIPCLGVDVGHLSDSAGQKKNRKSRYWSSRNLKHLYKVAISDATQSSKQGKSVSDSCILQEYVPLAATVIVPQVLGRPFPYDAATAAYLDGKGPPNQSTIPGTVQDVETGPLHKNALRVAELRKAVRDDPTNIETWLELLEFQNESDLGGEVGTKVYEKTLLEKKLAVLDRAIDANPKSVELITRRLELCGELWETNRLMTEWKHVLFLQPNNADLWTRYLTFLRTHFSSFTVSKFYGQFSKCMRMLNNICEGTFVSHGPTPDLEDWMLDIVCDMCHTMRQSGYGERALACFQALVEFNYFVPSNVSPDSPIEERLAFFEPFWDSGAPRFGEEGARGWAAVIRDRNDRPETASENASQNEDSLVDVDLTRSENWLRLERAREERHWLPWRSDTECEDPERTVLFDDVKPALFHIRNPNTKHRLLSTFLEFLGVKEWPHNAVDCSFKRCHRSSRLQVLDDATGSAGGATIRWEFANCSGREWEKDAYPQPLGPSNQHMLGITDKVFQQSAALLDAKHRQALNKMQVRYRCQAPGDWNEKRQKRRTNEALKSTKCLLELEENRNDVALWAMYGELEWDAGHESKARKVFDAVLANRCGFDVSDDPNDASQVDVVHAYRVYAELSAGLKSGTLDSLENTATCGISSAAWTLGHLGAGLAYIQKKGLTEQTPSTLFLRAKRRYALYQDSFSDSYCARDEHPPGDVLGGLLVEWTGCHSLFLYLTGDVAEAFAVYDRLLDRLEKSLPCVKKSRDFERLVYDKLRLLVFDNNRTAARPVRSVRATLEKALSLFPGNRHFLRLFLDIESRSHLVGRVRDFFNRKMKDKESSESGCILAAFAVCSEMERLHMLRTAVFDRMETIPETSIVHRIRALFEKAVKLRTNSNCVMLWRSYMRFEARNGKLKNAKAIFYRAAQQCPWAKSLYVDAVEYFPDDLQELIDLMTEKEIRVRTPIEEVDLLMESARLDVESNPIIKDADHAVTE